ncbi:hypothetical protein [Paraburkholderia acidiphila]|uniref:AAA ATPase domain-containing protein n=1 Tax=Paraburkholderia acidiphila TaxID=2571747 RepID=A0A7Z2GCV6_9BURK|nr:hypothetical protein [Paraburkholderia acidiphila]QGZ59472.1 hypothetical protein FAZ97_31245 [Paraburkholderia acidiphila]
MVIRIKPMYDPLNPGGDEPVITMRSETNRILEHELRRYCNGQIQGRSFLIAGHRGAGKTTMVADVVHRLMLESKAKRTRMRPLLVVLHGPSLFLSLSELSDDDIDGDAASAPATAQGQQIAGRAEPDEGAREAAPTVPADEPSAQTGREREPGAQSQETAVTGGGEAPAPERAAAREHDDAADTVPTDRKVVTDSVEEHAQRALEQVILGLHRAVVREYAAAFRTWVLAKINDPAPVAGAAAQAGDGRSGSGNELMQDVAEWTELAAQFELELIEDPSAIRLREFYAGVGALSTGILGVPGRSEDGRQPVADQGARELIALTGLCMAHQRISGELSETDRNTATDTRETHTESKFAWQNENLLKSFASIASGALVMGGAAAGQHALWAATLLGLATAVGASIVFRHSSSSKTRQEREIERTFIPDRTLRTLDRVLPMLLQWLMSAGLAPVLVIDELDKMGELSWRLEAMVRHLKKLMAENVFSCFLTDRGYLELVSMGERDKAYAKTYSYFSHPLFVTYEPGDLDQYMSSLFDTSGDSSAMIDCEVLKWMLRHRSQMHALALNREIAAIRNDAGNIAIADGDVRTLPVYKIDVTLQVAIEHRLKKDDLTGWLMQQPRMRLTILDALYFISREWRRGAEEIDLSGSGLDRLWQQLETRMNLAEVRRPRQNRAHSGQQSGALTGDDKHILCTVVKDLALALSADMPEFALISAVANPTPDDRTPRVPAPNSSVLDAVLIGNASVLIQVDGSNTRFRFRYSQSGNLRESVPAQPIQPLPPGGLPATGGIPEQGTPAEPLSKLEQLRNLRDTSTQFAAFLDNFEDVLRPILFSEFTPVQPKGSLYRYLADVIGVLPTTPAWSSVYSGRVRLDQAVYGQGNPAALEVDLGALEQFVDMIRTNAGLIALVLGTAAQLTALSGTNKTQNDLTWALDALSTGLKFHQLDSAGLRAVVEEFRKDLQKRVDGLIEVPNLADGYSPEPAVQIKRTVEEWLPLAQAAGQKFDWLAAIRRAWDNFSMDSSGKLLFAAQVDLIISIANRRGPANLFTVNPFEPSLEDWTTLVRMTLKSRGPPFPMPGDEAPPAVIALALRMLGFHLVTRDRAEPLANLFGRETSAAFESLVRTAGDGRGMVTSTAEPYVDEIVVVLSAAPFTTTQSWTAPQQRAAMLVMTSTALFASSQSFLELMALAGKIRLWWDGSPSQADREVAQKFFTDGVRAKLFEESPSTPPPYP